MQKKCQSCIIYWNVSGSHYQTVRLHTPPLLDTLVSQLFLFCRKSTFFNVLTKSQAAAENFPFCTIDPNESRVPIPDERYDFLCQFHKPARYGVTSFTYYSHFKSLVFDSLFVIGVRKRITMLLTCSFHFCMTFDCCSAQSFSVKGKAEASEGPTPGYHTHS